MVDSSLRTENMGERVIIHEVGPRDGLQNEAVVLPTDQKVGLVARLQAAGCSQVEVSSFVRPRWVVDCLECGRRC